MPNYEHVFICRQDLTSVQAETLADEFKGTLTENGGKVIDSEYWGLRSIAYRMNKTGRVTTLCLNWKVIQKLLLKWNV